MRFSRWLSISFTLLFATVISGCAQSPKHLAHETHAKTERVKCSTKPPPPYRPSAIVVEQDDIYTLLAYAVVYKDWQTHGWEAPDKARGYNIGGVLVNPQSAPGQQLLCWSRNSVIKTRNGTQHGEVRLLTNYIGNSSTTKVKGYKLYTTLEPCAMCSGMMTLQSLTTTVYGQTDPGYGGAIERLTLNSIALDDGWCPYPRGVQSVASPLTIRKEIDEAFARVGGSITAWLITPEARILYEKAVRQLENFKVRYTENRAVLAEARAFLKKVPSRYTPTPYTVACPPAR